MIEEIEYSFDMTCISEQHKIKSEIVDSYL
jgi:hypothetical protein